VSAGFFFQTFNQKKMINLISTNFKELSIEHLQVLIDNFSNLHRQWKEIFYEDRGDDDALMANIYHELLKGAEIEMEKKMELA
jgi:hypothetical protein